jgi:hypothetical protein
VKFLNGISQEAQVQINSMLKNVIKYKKNTKLKNFAKQKKRTIKGIKIKFDRKNNNQG